MGKAKQLAVLQSAGFSLIAVDTGILRTLEDKQMQWLEAALQRAGDNSKFVILGHPFYAAGADPAGDTHDLSCTERSINRVDFAFYPRKAVKAIREQVREKA